MSKLQGKHIIILESSDQGGKSSLSKYLQDNVEGKCHVLHSNYNPDCSKVAHRHQHFLLNRFASKQFKSAYYTKNNVVIMDRNYISDIIYGQIGYGSKGSYEQKLKTLEKLFKILRKGNSDVKISLVYCRPKNSDFADDEKGFTFDKSKKEELLTENQNEYIRRLYDNFFSSTELHEILVKFDIHYYIYNYFTDPDYKYITEELNRRPMQGGIREIL